MPGVRSVSIGIWVLAGSRDERPAISGHCHFLEHLLFKGTETRSALDIAEAFDAVGGDVNAFTAKEYTCYYARVLDRDLEMAVEHLVDMLLHSTITAADLAGETDVILSEIDMHEDSPEDMVHDVFTEALWPGHPLGRPILGTKDRIRASTRASVRGFYRRHYVPGRMVISVAGNVKHDRVLAMLADRMDVGRPLGARGRSAKEVRVTRRAPKPSGEHAIKRKRVEQAHIVLGTNGLARTDPDRFPFLIVNTVLGGGMSSRLFQEIREKRGLAYTAYSFHSQYTEAGVFSAYRRHHAESGGRGARPDAPRARRRPRRRHHRGGVRSREEPREGLDGPVAGRPGQPDVAAGQVRGLPRRDPHADRDAAARGRRDLGRCAPRGRAGTVPTDDARGRWARGDEGVARGRAVIRVGVLGAAGRMGREVCRAVAAADDLELVAVVDPNNAGLEAEGLLVSATIESLSGADVDVAVDFTLPSAVMPNVRWCLRNGIHAVVGTTGLDPRRPRGAAIRRPTPARPNCVVAPNFALGAVLLLRFAAEAARYFDAAEVIELHHDGKADAPSGTAIATARAIGAARAGQWSAPEAVGAVRGRTRRRGRGRTRARRAACPVSSRTKRCCSAGRARRCRCVTTRWTVPRSCRACSSRSGRCADRPGLTVGLDALLD